MQNAHNYLTDITKNIYQAMSVMRPRSGTAGRLSMPFEQDIDSYVSSLLGLDETSQSANIKSAINDDIADFMNVEDFLRLDDADDDTLVQLTCDEQKICDMATD